MYENRSTVVWVGETGVASIFSKTDTDYRKNVHAMLRREDLESFTMYSEIAVLLIELMRHDVHTFRELIDQIYEQVLDFPI